MANPMTRECSGLAVAGGPAREAVVQLLPQSLPQDGTR